LFSFVIVPWHLANKLLVRIFHETFIQANKLLLTIVCAAYVSYLLCCSLYTSPLRWNCFQTMRKATYMFS